MHNEIQWKRINAYRPAWGFLLSDKSYLTFKLNGFLSLATYFLSSLLA